MRSCLVKREDYCDVVGDYGGPSRRKGAFPRFCDSRSRHYSNSVRELRPHWSQSLRPGPAGRYRAGKVKPTSRHIAQQELPCKGEPRASGRWRHRNFGGSPVPRGVWGQERQAHSAAIDPYRPPYQAPQITKPDPGPRNDKSGCGEEKPKGQEQPEGAAREDLVDLRRRRTPGATAKC